MNFSEKKPAKKKSWLTGSIRTKGKRIIVDPKVCTGCRMCEVACSIKKERVINPEVSRIKVHPFHPDTEIPVVCYLCDDPKPCIAACPQSPPVISVNDKTMALKVDKKRCLGEDECGKCAKSCPAKAIHFHPKENYALICDLCDLKPACVGFCSALTFTSGTHPGQSFAKPPRLIAEQLRKSIYYYTKT